MMTPWGHFRRKRTFNSEDVRLYAIGDVHGCFDLLVHLLQRIEADQAARTPVETRIVLLGDYIDRGPQSRDVCELLFSMAGSKRVCCLKGNHEETMLDVLAGQAEALRFWLQYGGAETLRSWGISNGLIEHARLSEQGEQRLMAAFRSAVPIHLINWMRYLPTRYAVGDYLFVHAGIRPGVRLERQNERDLMWIREPFLRSRARHPAMIVHGHSEQDDPQDRPNRIGIDTAAYRSGVLTAVGIENNARWFIQTD
ncbi:metallophosphoesterase family protein [Sphingobium subterraneum]|uniref:Serine/threonine protein phosphatase 1 n=1 Tax=Sphingobium subterraneum TaxID=627688 RepID=A0A841JAH4_9SPHN|nr:metallophosphoesterase family protein [Sphingobium subterraneum]MBB6125141.1 serine/threonine protein phosphatase 1 [Sphingobium subterraneum]